MEEEALRTNLLAIMIAGLLMLFTGVLLYVFRGYVSANVRYFLPIPPLGVAAYIFVFNLYNFFGGKMPEGSWAVPREIMLGTLIAAVTFALFSCVTIFMINLIKR